MKISVALPTAFAKRLLVKVGLYCPDLADDRLSKMHNGDDLHKYLCEFQQMVSGGCSFDESLIAYHGSDVDLTPECIEALRVVEKSTYPWLKGHIVGILADKLEDESGKSFLEAAKILLNEIGDDNKHGKSTGIHLHFDANDRNA